MVGGSAGGGRPRGVRNRFPHPGARYLALSPSRAARGRRWFKDLRGLRRPADAHEGAPGRAEGGPPRREGRLRTPMPPSVPPRRLSPAPPVRGKPRTERGHPASLSASGPKGRGPSGPSPLPPPPSPPPPGLPARAFSARGGRKGPGARGAVAAGAGGSACTRPRPPGPCEPSAWTEPEPSGSVCETFSLCERNVRRAGTAEGGPGRAGRPGGTDGRAGAPRRREKEGPAGAPPCSLPPRRPAPRAPLRGQQAGGPDRCGQGTPPAGMALAARGEKKNPRKKSLVTTLSGGSLGSCVDEERS